jgi:polyphosphate kinase
MMHRNLDRRVEVMAQVKDPKLTKQLGDIFDSALDPTTRCWELGPDGGWVASPAQGESVREHQVELMRSRRNQAS